MIIVWGLLCLSTEPDLSSAVQQWLHADSRGAAVLIVPSSSVLIKFSKIITWGEKRQRKLLLMIVFRLCVQLGKCFLNSDLNVMSPKGEFMRSFNWGLAWSKKPISMFYVSASNTTNTHNKVTQRYCYIETQTMFSYALW